MGREEYYELLKAGLTDGEAKVYLSLSELGSSTVGPIVKKSRVAYSNIYDILNRLIEKGLVSFVIKSKTKYFQAASPNNLIEYLSRKEKDISTRKDELKKILPDLEKMQSSHSEQEAEVFLGLKGLRAAYEKMLHGRTKKDEILYFYLHEKEHAEKSDLFYNSIKNLSRNVSMRGIANKEYGGSWFAKKSKFINVRFVDFPIPSTIDIISNMVLIISWKPEIVGILIKSESIAHNLRNYFNEVWKSVKILKKRKS